MLILYRFSEGTGTTIKGYSQLESPVTLSGDTIHWLPGAKGIQIRAGSSPLKTVSPMRELAAALQKSSQFTVEAWIRTDNLEQGGPARILSLSADPDRRNFTLAQAGNDIHFRVRTPLTGVNGSRIHLVGRSVLTDTKPHHLVATFHHGVERLFIDGVPVRNRIRGDIDFLPAILNSPPGTLFKWALVLGLMLPLGLLVQNLFLEGRRYYGFLLFVNIVVIIELGISICFKQPYGWTLVLVSLMPTALVVLYRKRFW